MTQLTMDEQAQRDRIEGELRAAGMGRIGLLRFGPRYLYRVVAHDEHITGVVHGRYRQNDKAKAPAWGEGALVATDQRVLFLDHKPGFLRLDDIPYDTVAGVETVWAWPWGGVTLFTRNGVYALEYVPNRTRDQFVNYIEEHRLDKS